MERFERNGHVELALVGNPDDYDLVRRMQRITRDLGGALHWGQSNGMMTPRDVEAIGYGEDRRVAKLSAAARRGDVYQLLHEALWPDAVADSARGSDPASF